MGLWEDNLFTFYGGSFSTDAQDLIRAVFVSATQTLDQEWNKYLASFHEYISKPLEEDEAGIACQERDWMEDTHWQRKQGVGALALDWLMCSFQEGLNGIKKHFDTSHPADVGGYKNGKGWLAKISNEYKKRFDINFETGPTPFDRIEELVLARNAGIHRTAEGMQKYLRKIANPRFVGTRPASLGEDEFFVTEDALVLIIKDCEQFLDWIISELRKHRP